MEGVGLFTVAKYRNCQAAVVYVITGILNENGWNLGWDDAVLSCSIKKVVSAIQNLNK